MSTDFFAHTPASGSDAWNPLSSHLMETAELASSFGRNESERQRLYFMGLLHDLGKYQAEFQAYLNARHQGKFHTKTPHAIFGAIAAYKLNLLDVSFAIAGHHSGIPNKSALKNKLNENMTQFSGKVKKLLQVLEKETGIAIENIDTPSYDTTFFVFDINTRFAYSVLVDSDYICTERHFNISKYSARKHNALFPGPLIENLNAKLDSFRKVTSINELRTKALRECLAGADRNPGFFSLILPTGLGKTLSSVAWALKHAERNSLKRLIIVLPYTNIIDQTALELKDVFGEDAVLEHHSGIVEKDDEEEKHDPRKLAAENWSFPIIITTTVQFFESLFSNRPSKCRKVHNIAESVVIFDEVQTLPKESIKPTLRMIGDVQKCFHASFLFCTATMPAFEKRNGLRFGLENVTPLIENPLPYFNKTRRVEYSLVNDLLEIEVSELMQLVTNNGQSALVIFNSKKDAFIFYQSIHPGDWERKFHLSTAMCPHHRKSILEEIKTELKNKRKIIAITTQLVEAGVDFDFPTVFRAVAPLDSIIQAAGRCNREGELIDQQGNLIPGRVHIFRTKNMGMPYDKTYKTATEFSETYIRGKLDEMFTPEFYAGYYKTLMANFIKEDKAGIDEIRENLQFSKVAEVYKIIDSPATPVFIKDYNEESTGIFNKIVYKPYISRKDHAQMQLFIVQLYPALRKSANDFIEELENGVLIWNGDYDEETGIKAELNYMDYVL